MTKKLYLFICVIAGMAMMQSCTKEVETSASVSDQTLSRMSQSTNDFVYLTSAATMSSFRIRMNKTASEAYQKGERLNFPANSMFVKEKLNAAGQVSAYDIMYRSSADPHSSNGWVWTETDEHGNVTYGSENKGANCQNCHASGAFSSRF